jgi:ketosteroid isomerase-like protein
MSRENVEIVRSVLEGANSRDSERTLALYDPAVVWDHTEGPIKELMGGPTVYHGHEGLRRWFREYYEAWGDVQAEIIELIDAGNEVVSVINYRSLGRASGIEVEFREMAGVWTVEDGKVTKAAWFRTRAEAIETAGLSE